LTANADVETIVVASQDQPRPKELDTKTAKEMIGKQSKVTQASMDSSDRNEAKFE
jgi:hypothetical protein